MPVWCRICRRPHPVVFRHVLSMMLVTGSDIGRDVLSQFLARSLRVMEHCIFKASKADVVPPSHDGDGKREHVLRLRRREVIPPFSEVTVNAVLDTSEGLPTCALTIPDGCFQGMNDVMMAHALVSPTVDGVPVRVLNYSDEAVALERAMQIGRLEPISEVMSIMTRRHYGRWPERGISSIS